ncbi:AEC family transporter [Pararhizobium mangrovi]|uniref:AEC family transporter n=1 Tax=Pararhizobium mangrovi TaxID=2590452 RepID=A0A506U5C3_9HYPH|nr:AEC family transporter [Pararhizobium mangrovi]TPW27127.1 AEC family transporter [Pararhizobium mangrovi]
MIPIFESIVPVFLIVLLGVALRRWRAIDAGFWRGLEQMGYYVLFPAFLFQTLYTANFSNVPLVRVGGSALLSVFLVSLLLLLAWPPLARRGLAPASFTTIFQTSSRWNAFVALAVAEKLAGAEGVAVVAFVMAVIVLPINLVNVSVLVWFSNSDRQWLSFVRRIVTNPVVLASLAGLAARALPFAIYPPVDEAIALVGRAALGLGLIMVGAGLRIEDALRPGSASLGPLVVKLVGFPILMMALGTAFGVDPASFYMLVLCASVPTAMNGFVLARQLGGDAPLYAVVTTLQVIASFFTIPGMLWLASVVGG